MPTEDGRGPDAGSREVVEQVGDSRAVGGPLWSRVAFVAAAVLCLSPWGSPPVALAVGMALALTVGNPFSRVTKPASKWLLQASVVLMGFGMDFSVVLRTGANGFVFAALTILGTFALGFVLARWLAVPRETSTLISAGTAICGGSAIAAVGAVIGATEASMTVAMGTVFMLNAVALYVFPALGAMLHLTQHQFGVWSGIAIHDVSSVVGAASQYGEIALQTATAVKLSRALWIIPVALCVAWVIRRRSATPEAGEQRGKPGLPWFILAFVMASMARSVVPGVAAIAPSLVAAAKAGMTLTLFCIGGGLSVSMLKSVGVRPLVQGVALWLFISLAALLIVLGTVA